MSVSRNLSVDPVVQLTQRLESFQHNELTQALFFVISIFTHILSGTSLDFTRWRAKNLAAEFDCLEELVSRKQISGEEFNEICELFNTAIKQMGNQWETVSSKVVKRELDEKVNCCYLRTIARLSNLEYEKIICSLTSMLDNLMVYDNKMHIGGFRYLSVNDYPELARIAELRFSLPYRERYSHCFKLVPSYFSSSEGRKCLLEVVKAEEY